MKQILITAAILMSLCGNAQKTIIDEKFVKGENPVGHYFNESTIYILKGEQVRYQGYGKIKKVDLYNLKGDKKTLFQDQNLRAFLPSNLVDDAFYGIEVEKKEDNDRKYFIKNAVYDVKEIDHGSTTINLHGIEKSFTDKYLFGLTNQDSKAGINLKNDDLYLEALDFKTKTTSRSKIEKPDISRLIGASFVETKEFLGFDCRIKKDNSFELITKSISKDYKTSILYRTFYNQQAKKTGETFYNVEIPNYFLISSNNDGGHVLFHRSQASNAVSGYLQDDLSVNNFFENNTGDIYIYGLFSKKPSERKEKIEAAGYYVFKFDKTGNQVWKSINVIDDKKYFNDGHSPAFTFVKVKALNKKLVFSAAVNDNDEFMQYAVLDEVTGKILNSNNLIYHQQLNKRIIEQFIVSDMQIKSVKEDRNFNIDAIIAFDMNKEIQNYILSNKSKKDIQFQAEIAKEGIWLIESDNKEYYKVTFFEDKP